MSPTHDVIVIGLGGMGSAVAHHLSARGARVLGLEKFGPVHDRGSSHGGSRIAGGGFACYWFVQRHRTGVLAEHSLAPTATPPASPVTEPTAD